MQHQYVALDFPTQVPTSAVVHAIAAQTLGMAGRAVYQLINERSRVLPKTALGVAHGQV